MHCRREIRNHCNDSLLCVWRFLLTCYSIVRFTFGLPSVLITVLVSVRLPGLYGAVPAARTRHNGLCSVQHARTGGGSGHVQDTGPCDPHRPRYPGEMFLEEVLIIFLLAIRAFAMRIVSSQTLPLTLFFFFYLCLSHFFFFFCFSPPARS